MVWYKKPIILAEAGANLFRVDDAMMMAAEHELVQYCQILFDLDRDVPREFLDYIQLSGLKSAYRKKARESHPDLAIGQGAVVQRRRVDQFLAVQQAYESLTNYLKVRDKRRRFGKPQSARAAATTPRPGAHCRPTPEPTATRPKPDAKAAKKDAPTERRVWDFDTLYEGALPRRPLLLGHFLYYAGAISWRDIVGALLWQRQQRPRLGEIGCRLGWLQQTDILGIIRGREFPAPFGETAVRQGLLSDNQLKILLWHQKRLQRKFGEYFIEQRIITALEFERLLDRFHAHNRQFSNPPH